MLPAKPTVKKAASYQYIYACGHPSCGVSGDRKCKMVRHVLGRHPRGTILTMRRKDEFATVTATIDPWNEGILSKRTHKQHLMDKENISPGLRADEMLREVL